jgi:hypothetical protein
LAERTQEELADIEAAMHALRLAFGTSPPDEALDQ